MAVRIAIISDPILVVNVYAPRDNPIQEALFVRLLHLLMEYDGPVFMGWYLNTRQLRELTVLLPRYLADTTRWHSDGFSVGISLSMFLKMP